MTPSNILHDCDDEELIELIVDKNPSAINDGVVFQRILEKAVLQDPTLINNHKVSSEVWLQVLAKDGKLMAHAENPDREMCITVVKQIVNVIVHVPGCIERSDGRF